VWFCCLVVTWWVPTDVTDVLIGYAIFQKSHTHTVLPAHTLLTLYREKYTFYQKLLCATAHYNRFITNITKRHSEPFQHT